MVTQIAYTNSNCSDLWKMFIDQNQKHTEMQLCLTTDEFPEENYNLESDNVIIYSNTDPYYKVWVDAAEKFGGDYFIYLQEDFILYADVNQKKIDEYATFLKNNPEYSFVRLLKSGQLNDVRVAPNLFEIESTNINAFSMQATIWRTTDYILLMNMVQDAKWLENSKYSEAMTQLGMKGVYHYDGEPKRGGNHWDNNIYPYVATALVRSKWNLKEYNAELGKILTEYNIDINKRGIL
jgi:hypothetical protein